MAEPRASRWWWTEAVARLGGDPDVAQRAADDLTCRHGEDHRRHHDLRHASSVARDADDLAQELGLGGEDRAVITLAACAHDVVYDARPGHERLSAEWTARWLGRAGLTPERIGGVERLILATIGHEAPAGDLLATALLDADLAILVANPATTTTTRRRCARSTRPSTTPRGRPVVLTTLLDRDALCRSRPSRNRWDIAARENLTRELTRLRHTSADQ
jgi:predicted metal-dependent HD superfamily phosphohydrolase